MDTKNKTKSHNYRSNRDSSLKFDSIDNSSEGEPSKSKSHSISKPNLTQSERPIKKLIPKVVKGESFLILKSECTTRKELHDQHLEDESELQLNKIPAKRTLTRRKSIWMSRETQHSSQRSSSETESKISCNRIEIKSKNKTEGHNIHRDSAPKFVAMDSISEGETSNSRSIFKPEITQSEPTSIKVKPKIVETESFLEENKCTIRKELHDKPQHLMDEANDESELQLEKAHARRPLTRRKSTWQPRNRHNLSQEALKNQTSGNTSQSLPIPLPPTNTIEDIVNLDALPEQMIAQNQNDHDAKSKQSTPRCRIAMDTKNKTKSHNYRSNRVSSLKCDAIDNSSDGEPSKSQSSSISKPNFTQSERPIKKLKPKVVEAESILILNSECTARKEIHDQHLEDESELQLKKIPAKRTLTRRKSIWLSRETQHSSQRSSSETESKISCNRIEIESKNKTEGHNIHRDSAPKFVAMDSISEGETSNSRSIFKPEITQSEPTSIKVKPKIVETKSFLEEENKCTIRKELHDKPQHLKDEANDESEIQLEKAHARRPLTRRKSTWQPRNRHNLAQEALKNRTSENTTQSLALPLPPTNTIEDIVNLDALPQQMIAQNQNDHDANSETLECKNRHTSQKMSQRSSPHRSQQKSASIDKQSSSPRSTQYSSRLTSLEHMATKRQSQNETSNPDGIDRSASHTPQISSETIISCGSAWNVSAVDTTDAQIDGAVEACALVKRRPRLDRATKRKRLQS